MLFACVRGEERVWVGLAKQGGPLRIQFFAHINFYFFLLLASHLSKKVWGRSTAQRQAERGIRTRSYCSPGIRGSYLVCACTGRPLALCLSPVSPEKGCSASPEGRPPALKVLFLRSFVLWCVPPRRFKHG